MLGSFERLVVAALTAVAITTLSGAVLLSPEPQQRSSVHRPAKPVAGTPVELSAEPASVPAGAAAGEAPRPPGDYDLAAVAAGAPVPRIIVTMRRDAAASAAIDPRQAFVHDLLPLVLLVNEEALGDRARLWEIRVKRDLGQPLTVLDRLWLAVAAERYGTGANDIDQLSQRIDAAPPSLVLAAAAAATDWGRAEPAKSRSALISTALSTAKPAGSRGRSGAIGYELPADTVRAFLHALNVDPAMAAFRDERAQLRRTGAPLAGPQLAGFVGFAGTSGGRLRALIEAERLDRFDAARLDPAGRDGSDGGGRRTTAGLL